MLPILCSVLIACSSGASSVVGPDSQEPKQIASLEVHPSEVELAVGDTARLEVEARNGSDAPVSLQDGEVRWSSSDTTVVSVDASGLVRTLKDGVARVEVELAHPKNGHAPKDSARVRSMADDSEGGSGSDGGGGSDGSGGDDSGGTGSGGTGGTSTPSNDFRAFPGAEGWGAQALTTCDRSGMQVLWVMNRNDSGPGSLRDAISRARADVLTVILFDVAGYIDLTYRIEIQQNASCLYIAGQSAPGDGITIRAWDTQAFMFKSGPVRDVVIRYLRFRNGTKNPGYHGSAQGILMMTGENVVIDHVSFSWANDQLLSVSKAQFDWGPLRNVSLQRLLLAEPLAASPVCYGAGGHKEAGADGVPPIYKVEHLSYHHNAAIHCSHRAPTLGVRDAHIINNVVYNWNQAAMQQGRKVYVDYVGNYFKGGPMNPPLDASYGWEFSHEFALNYPQEGEPDGYRVIGNTNNVDGRKGPTLYLSGNVGPHNPTGELDNWAMTSKYKNDERNGRPESYYSSVQYADVGKMPVSVDGVSLRRTARTRLPPIPVTTQSAFAAWESLVEDEDVGANRRLACNGDWIRRADAVDKRVLREARNGTGRARSADIASQDEVGGFPSLDPGTPCSDTDGDGMPDEFEVRHGLAPDARRDAAVDSDGDGYTNLEEYLNGTPPR